MCITNLCSSWGFFASGLAYSLLLLHFNCFTWERYLHLGRNLKMEILCKFAMFKSTFKTSYNNLKRVIGNSSYLLLKVRYFLKSIYIFKSFFAWKSDFSSLFFSDLYLLYQKMFCFLARYLLYSLCFSEIRPCR